MDKDCYVKFKIASQEKMQRLILVFNTVKADLEADCDESIINEWIALLEELELNRFWWPNEAEILDFQQIWGSIKITYIRDMADNPNCDWDAYSLFKDIRTCDFEWLAIRQIDAESACFQFRPWSYPYGGTASLQKFISLFGHQIIKVNERKTQLPLDTMVHTYPVAIRKWQAK